MNELTVFNFEAREVRTILINGEPWFVAKDIALLLGYKWQTNLIAHVPPQWKGVNPINTLGGTQEMAVLSEQGLYFFLGRSDKPKALLFQMWLADEVLPSIRKTGGYVSNDDLFINTYLPFVDENTKALFKLQLEVNRKAAEQIAEMKPKADFFDAVTDSKDAVDMASVAKVLNMGIGRNKLFEFLRNKKVLQSNNQPYQRYIDSGYFRVIEQKYQNSQGETHISFKTIVYQKGIDFIRKLLNG